MFIIAAVATGARAVGAGAIVIGGAVGLDAAYGLIRAPGRL
jgi:hypothetical protein